MDSDKIKVTKYEFLFKNKSPWIYIGGGEEGRHEWIPSFYYVRDNLSVCVRKLRGWKMKTIQDLMNEFSAALQFFDGFGENWYSLEECLCYIDELIPADAYILVVEGAQDILIDENDSELKVFLEIMNSVGGFFAKEISNDDRFDRVALPFHVLLNTSNESETRIKEIAKSANIAFRI